MKAFNINPHNNPELFTYWLVLTGVLEQTHDNNSETLLFSLLGNYPQRGLDNILHYNLFEYDIVTDVWDSVLGEDIPDNISEIDIRLISEIPEQFRSDEDARDHLYMLPMEGQDDIHFYTEELPTFCEVLAKIVPTIRLGNFENWDDVDLGDYDEWVIDDSESRPRLTLVVDNDKD